MSLVGWRTLYRTVGRGVAHCERCGGDRAIWRRAGRRWMHLLGVPLVPAGAAAEHLACTVCQTCYRVELLAVPTVAQMRAALAAGTKAAVLAVLRAGCAAARPPSPATRRRAVDLIRRSGVAGYGEDSLARDLAAAGDPVARPGSEPGGLVIERLALQLEEHAREWFLASVVQVGLDGGRLGEPERAAVGAIARCLGVSQARASDVIWMAEAAQAG